MTPERWRQTEELYHLAREHGPSALSGADPDLRRDVEELLAEEADGKILDQRAAELLPEQQTLGIGALVGPYRIEGILGTGGMGEVYWAQDTKLKRRVAIKVLPSAFAHDPERLARFQREAEVLAQLNHPNIAHIYGAEESALVMELVEGESPKGPLPFGEAWKIALQIADALEYAHERGVIHRDLKPANVKVTPDGVVKLLDFGLAKALSDPSGAVSPEADNSPEPPLDATADGVVLGTAPYMSPEQAKGKRLDRRTDIWSWGVLFYELLTGEQVFRATSFSETVALVLTRNPDLDRVPANVRRLLRSCLEKDPKQRLRDIGDVSRLIDAPPESQPSVRSRSIPVWVALGVVLVTAAVSGVLWFTKPVESRTLLRFDIALANATNIDSFAISPDGRYLAITAEMNGKRQLWLRALNALSSTQPMANTEDARSPFWSPDSREIGFFTQGQLKKIAATGGSSVPLCDVTDGRSGSWSRDNMILFSTGVSGGAIQLVSAYGGDPVDVIKGNDLTLYPVFLPDGRRFLYSHNTDIHAVYLGSLDGKENRRILQADSSVVLAPGWLLFIRANTLMAQPFDAAAGRVMGDAVALTEGISAFRGNTSRSAPIAVSDNGVLIYEGAPANAGNMQMGWYDRSGKLLKSVGDPGAIFDPAISPDQSRIAFRRFSNSYRSDLWLWDLKQEVGEKITEGGDSNHCFPQWSPDGSRIALSSNTKSNTPDAKFDIYLRTVGETGDPEPLLITPRAKFLTDWSRDGRFIVYSVADTKTRQDLWVLPMEGRTASKPILFLGSKADEVLGKLSPDEHWMAYTSDEAGQREVYVRPFPSGDGQWKISMAGGEESRWRADGRELYFVRPDGMMMAVPVKGAPGPKPVFEAGTPQPLFRTHLARTTRGVGFEYDVSPDGQRFLLDSVVEGSLARPLTVVVNWSAGLKR